jgi:hypothetical protein
MLFIKIYFGTVANAVKTLKKTVKISKLISNLNDEYLISQLKDYEKYKEFSLWDLGKRAAASIKIQRAFLRHYNII